MHFPGVSANEVLNYLGDIVTPNYLIKICMASNIATSVTDYVRFVYMYVGYLKL